MALLRAADLALAHGASYFVLLQQLRESRSFPTPPFVPFPYTSYGYGYWGPPNTGIVVRDHRAQLAIRLLRDQPQASDSAYSATLLRYELSRTDTLDPQ